MKFISILVVLLYLSSAFAQLNLLQIRNEYSLRERVETFWQKLGLFNVEANFKGWHAPVAAQKITPLINEYFTNNAILEYRHPAPILPGEETLPGCVSVQSAAQVANIFGTLMSPDVTLWGMFSVANIDVDWSEYNPTRARIYAQHTLLYRDLALSGTTNPEGWDFFDANYTAINVGGKWKFSSMYLLSRANVIVNQEITRIGNIYYGPYPFGAPCV